MVLVNIVGFFLGVGLAALLSLSPLSPLAIHPIATFLCTEIIGWVAEYAVRAREETEKATEKANLAHFRYLKLKQQVNPHFLFNSLNVLDCMIKEQSTEEASEYTHKLAEIYRYMLKNEDETTVKLRDEMEFVKEYIDLLKVRFQDGLKVTVDISEEALSRSVVPCGVQILIENATKHNTIDSACPLEIEIQSSDNSILVSNEIHPRLHSSHSSTGLGLRYLRNQYKDIAGKSITVKDSNKKFTVTLPLL